MIQCVIAKKIGSVVRQQTFVHDLHGALDALFSVYAETGPGSEHAAHMLATMVDEAAARNEASHPMERPGSQHRVYTLIRARDMHRFITANPAQSSFMQRFMETGLVFRDAHARWAAQRALLLEHLPALCGAPYAGWGNNLERYKVALSDGSSLPGVLLRAAALINLDDSDEQPPANMVLRFVGGTFPEHYWELVSSNGKMTHHRAGQDWVPEAPLNRWGYLAGDLLSAVCARVHQERAGRAGHAPNHQAMPNPAMPLYYRWGAEGAGEDTGDDDVGRVAQMDLLPLEPAAFLQDINREVSRRMGPEGIRLMAALFLGVGEDPGTGKPRNGGAMDGHIRVMLEPEDICARAALPDDTARTRKERLARLDRLTALLGRVLIVRRQETGDATEICNPLLREDKQDQDMPGHPLDGEKAGAVRWVVDAVFGVGGEDSLDAPYRGLPTELWAVSSKAAPYVIPLYALLMRHAGANGDAMLEGSAEGLLERAGIWVAPSGRYKAVEGLKASLRALKEAGCLSGWKVAQGQGEGVIRQQYTLSLPSGSAQARMPIKERDGNGWDAPMRVEAGG